MVEVILVTKLLYFARRNIHFQNFLSDEAEKHKNLIKLAATSEDFSLLPVDFRQT